MIPTSFLSRLSLPSPQQTERDLARLIHRTIELDRRASRQLGYAAVNIGCDGVRRVTMFDGSSCQTGGDVCLATREEGITVCLDTPSGAGLAFQRITFAAPACEPVTGWWIVDAEGYMYRVPASLVAAAPYWPMTADPAVPAPAVTLVRSGTWAALMCAAPLTIPLNAGGGAILVGYYEGTRVVEQYMLLDGETRNNQLSGPGGVEYILVKEQRGIILRDFLAPNAGQRSALVTLPTAGSGIVSGAVRVGVGYPYATQVNLGPTGEEYYPRIDFADIHPYVYPLTLAVEYGADHLNLAGDDIADVSDSDEPPTQPTGVPLDPTVDLVALPNGEVALYGQGPVLDLRLGKHYRVRPAPDTALVAAVEHRAKGAWGDDANVWGHEMTISINPWAAGPSNVTATVYDMTGQYAPGRAVQVILWEANTIVTNTYRDAAVRWDCLLGETAVGVTQLLDLEGNPFTLPASAYTYHKLTFVGPKAHTSYGWTALVQDGPSGTPYETALSPITSWDSGKQYAVVVSWGGPTYSVKLSVPAGPTGTVERYVYRWTHDGRDPSAAPPWRPSGAPNNVTGGLYDRAFRRVLTVSGGAAVDVYDTETSLHNVGTRPPSPLVYLGPIVLDAPRPVHVLQPMEL